MSTGSPAGRCRRASLSYTQAWKRRRPPGRATRPGHARPSASVCLNRSRSVNRSNRPESQPKQRQHKAKGSLAMEAWRRSRDAEPVRYADGCPCVGASRQCTPSSSSRASFRSYGPGPPAHEAGAGFVGRDLATAVTRGGSTRPSPGSVPFVCNHRWDVIEVGSSAQADPRPILGWAVLFR